MKFELIPIVDTMFDLYEKPRSQERFQEYISILRDPKNGDLTLPIAGFNPMAKGHILQKLIELKELKAEQVVQDTLQSINITLTGEQDPRTFKVVLNLADDLMGGWTNRYTTDYDSKFKINALVTRTFCTPFFWTSESYTEQLVRSRTLEYTSRTIYWLTNPKPKTLKDHIEQEIYVAEMSKLNSDNFDANDFELLDNFYSRYQESDDSGIVFNFLYGDSASKSLEFSTHGITGKANGFDYAKVVYSRRNLAKST
jgi:hypothetical protein